MYVCPTFVGAAVGFAVGARVAPGFVGARVVGAAVGRRLPHAQHAWITARLRSPFHALPTYPPEHQFFDSYTVHVPYLSLKPALSTHCFVGLADGATVGCAVGLHVWPAAVGFCVGAAVGAVGAVVGLGVFTFFVGLALGAAVGDVGLALGVNVCPAVVGTRVGAAVGFVGLPVGLCVWPQNVGLAVVGLAVGFDVIGPLAVPVGFHVCPTFVGA